jgi:hypothetical protein
MGAANESPAVAAGNAIATEPVPAPTILSGLGPTGRLINLAFIVGILMAIVCLIIAATYLLRYLAYATGALEAINASQGRPEMLMLHMYMSRVLLQSCGLAVGMAFGFLGFSLFLLGVNGSIDASATSGGGLGLQVARLSPGAFVMLCSAILVGICATRDIPASIGATQANQANQVSAQDDASRYAATHSGNSEPERDYDNVPADTEGGVPTATVVR